MGQNGRMSQRVARLFSLLQEVTEGRFRRTPLQRAMAPVLDRARQEVFQIVMSAVMELF